MGPSLLSSQLDDNKPGHSKLMPADVESIGNLPLSNPSLQVTPQHEIKLVEAPLKIPKHGEVLLHIKATGICGYVWRIFILDIC
jgi:L-iditol 2-dehydrogenase